MTGSARHYFASLDATFSRIEVCSENLLSADVDEVVERAIELILKTSQAGGKVIFIGNGGSAAIASHQAVDLWKNGGIRAMAFNDSSLLTCVSNDYGYELVFEKPIAMFADSFDLVIAISSSGRSPNILKAVERAKMKGCKVLTLSGFYPDNPLRSMGHLNFYVPSESYGVVEILHLALCHYMVDQIIATKKNLKPRTEKALHE